MKSKQEVLDLFKKYVIANYTRHEVVFTHAENCTIWDIDGKKYLDFFPGWATTSIGHCHPRVVRAVQAQVAQLIHVDNTFYTVPQGELAQLISDHSFGGKCFFCNSGAEANEAAIKLARIFHHAAGRFKIITMLDSFHGRTMATITATGQDKYHRGIGPLSPGFDYVPFNDLAALKAKIGRDTGAILMEPIQGEGGINVAAPDYVRDVRRLCDESGILLIFDEVQTGMGRTGKWFGYQHYGIAPDIMTLAKALGGGVAIGAMVARPQIAEHLKPGLHASTFGGNPLACAAGIAVFHAIEQDGLLDNCVRMGKYFRDRLDTLAAAFPSVIKEVRGMGLMLGVELRVPGDAIFKRCLSRGLRINCTHERVLRLMPPITVAASDIDQAMALIEEAVAWQASNG